ncbi:SUKH-3 domain-containing protein [Micromonospora sp. WMMD1082]|uniref:SUKH-3 domain-containing protein n=1 Tax=Micromonospora sp. WMMD1082 TaxID=3016104 RepID=UPI002417B4BA|nr:SUKH-3 domain-containing protein [Micromonospora sp. WMMD1082]MDG4793183.1 SUKH-3 domain-containing protein [Micromonospora sp. WMMD1082]
MIDREQAEQIAAVWARRDSLRLGRDCQPVVTEFDLGYVITSTVSTPARALPGDLPTTVVDKQTGEVTTWPRVPPEVVERLYRRSRSTGPRFPRTVDPAGQLLREIRRLPTPTTTAHLTLDGRIFTARGAKGDVTLHHHPLVRAYLDELPAGRLVRGGDRHAEFVVVSDVLHEYDHRRNAEGIAQMSTGDARDLLESARIEVFQVREPGDPHGGPAERPCDSCLDMLVEFHALPSSERAHTVPRLAEPAPDPAPGRFPPEVAHALVAAGWRPHFDDAATATSAMHDVAAVRGRTHEHAAIPAATAALTAFPSLTSERRGPGEQVWISPFDVRPRRVAHTADSLGDFATVIGARLFPIGTESRHSIIAVDEHGRIFALDQAGEWFLGADIDAALITLLLGRAPARVRDDGSW